MPTKTARPHPVKALIKRRGISQRKLSNDVPCDQSFLTLVLNGKRKSTPRIRARLSELLGEPEDALFLPDNKLPRTTDEYRKLVHRLVRAQLRAQGLPEKVTDEQVLARLARIVLKVERKANVNS